MPLSLFILLVLVLKYFTLALFTALVIDALVQLHIVGTWFSIHDAIAVALLFVHASLYGCH